MNIKVTKTEVIVTNDYILNDKEYNVNKCYFTFSEEYTNELVKKAIFVQGTSIVEEPILNNECLIPSEVLNRGTYELRVYAYQSQDDELLLRYSPTPALVYVRAGSYIEGAESPEVITPSQFEQYMQALNDGLNEVANVDIDAEQLTNGAKITITDRTGTSKIVYVYNGDVGATPHLTIGTVETGSPSNVTITGTPEEPVLNFVLEKGETGETGPTGNGIVSVSKTGTSGLVDTYTITFTNGNTTTFEVTNGRGIVSIEKTETVGYVDTYTITYNDNTTSTFTVTNSEVTNEEFEALKKEVEYNEKYANALIKNTNTGTELTINDTANCPMPMSLAPSELAQANVLLPSEYTQVDYIEANATQRIDTTYTTDKTKKLVYETSIMWNDITTNQNCGADFGAYFGVNNSKYKIGTNTTDLVPSTTQFDKIIATMDMPKNKQYIEINSVTSSEYTRTNWSPKQVGIFDLADIGAHYFCNCKMKYFKIYEDNILVRYFVPCFRNSDNVIGMYDLITNEFYTKAVGNLFTKGSNSVLPNPDFPIDIHTITGNNTITIQNKNWLNVDKVLSVNTRKRITLTLPAGRYHISCGNVTKGGDNNPAFAGFGSWFSLTTNGDNTRTLAQTTTLTIEIYSNGYNYSASSGITSIIENLMISREGGEYEPYTIQTLPLTLGDLEYCKMPNTNYADEFYLATESDTSLVAGKWYLKKNIEKEIMTGSGTHVIDAFYADSNNRAVINHINSKVVPYNDNIACLNKFSFDETVYNASGTNVGYCMRNNNQGILIRFDVNGAINTRVLANEWLQEEYNNGTPLIIYYVLATPQYILLNDTLQSQLTEIYNWVLSYQDQTNISQVNADLPFVINAMTVYDLNKLLTRVETLESEV